MDKIINIIINVAFVALAVMGLYMDYPWAYNLLVFYSCVVGIMCMICLCSVDKMIKAAGTNTTLEKAAEYSCDFAIMMLLASKEHWWYAACFMISITSTANKSQRIKELGAK